MRIDLPPQSSPDPSSRPSAASLAGAPDFGELLEAFSRPAPPPAAPAPRPDPSLYAEVRAQVLEQRAAHQEQEEIRREGYLNGLEASQDHMEDLVENWKDRSPHKPDPESAKESQGDSGDAQAEISELLDSADDLGAIISDFEELPLDTDLPGKGEGGEAGGGRGGAHAEGEAESGNLVVERELSYQEIQNLVDTALNSGRHLPPRVRQVLQELLGSLLDGQRWLLDQHRLIGLERDEWALIQGMFPPHFYAGLLRQHRQSSLPLYDLLQDLFEQTAPDPARREDLLTLWRPALGEPLLLRNWLLDQPLIAQPDELSNLLEIWQHSQALPPGATGRTLQLALIYRHHPEKMQDLFLLAGSLLHRKPLTDAQVGLLAQCIGERCFTRELTDVSQIQSLLSQVLRGYEPDERELMTLVSGCSQGLLSYLPHACLAQTLKDLQDYVRRDLLGREDTVPDLLREDAA